MTLTHLELVNFRNHARSVLDFGRRVNILVGDNGEGKTNVLEAISYLSLTKSFYAQNDAVALQSGREWFQVTGSIRSDAGHHDTVRVSYEAALKHKVFLVNGARPEHLATVIGRFPIVVLSPENGGITFGGPAERRKFIDLLLSQLSRSYFQDLIEFRRVLRQRNSLLAERRISGVATDEALAPWTAALVRLGGRVIAQRLRFAGEFGEYVRRTYAMLVSSGEEPGMIYATLPGLSAAADERAAGEALAVALKEGEGEERRRGVTLVGPHRDELRFMINDAAVQQHASQGQHKTLLIALKVAEFLYLCERVQETPVFLLDDVFSELDRHRSMRILEVIPELGQTMITCTGLEVFGDALRGDGENRVFEVSRGAVRAA